MLVTFRSTSYADITMFGEIATRLLKMMGQSGQVPGAITAENVPAALDALQKNLATVEPEPAAGDEDDAPVSLATRAQPLTQLLEAAIASGADVIWES